jgi:segregation and condensation protein B
VSADGAGTSRPLRADVEAVLLVADEPVTAATLAKATGATTQQTASALQTLAAEYADGERGLSLRQVAGGWRLYAHPAAAASVRCFLSGGRARRLSPAAAETLAIVAYKQPVTRASIAAVRGVDVDGAVRSLSERGLIEEVGRDDSPGQPRLYGTTTSFLERCGLDSLDSLPPLPAADPLPAEPEPGGGGETGQQTAPPSQPGTRDGVEQARLGELTELSEQLADRVHAADAHLERMEEDGQEESSQEADG